ncbi:hypothetical protein Bca4012_047812 [Brassica carinata]
MVVLALPFPRVCGESADSNLSEGEVWLFGYSLTVQGGSGLLVVWPWAISISIFHGVLNLLFHVRLEPSPVMFGFSRLYLLWLLCVCVYCHPFNGLSFQDRLCVTVGLCTECNPLRFKNAIL